jgi:signal transduction histidine kinase
MLGRIGVRQRLGVLLAIPLIAVVVVAVPLTVDRIDNARAAGATATAATAAREVGALIQGLQQERLLALGYLTTTSLDRSAFLARAQTSTDDAARLRQDPATAAALQGAAGTLSALVDVRERVALRVIDPREAYSAYRATINALLTALRLPNPEGADSVALRQLAGLESLMFATEEASSVGALLVAISGDPSIARSLLTDAIIAQRLHTARFRSLATPAQAAIVDTVDQGKAAARIEELINTVYRQVIPNQTPGQVADALTAAVSYTGLRRLAQDRIAREITTDAQARAAAARTVAISVAVGGVLLLVVAVVLGVLVSRSISRPLRRLTGAAIVVANMSRNELVRVADSEDPDPDPPQLAAVDIGGSDEIGALASALNRVQVTAALLLERQVTSRRNVAVMFANIARRTQNLVGRQLALIEDMEKHAATSDTLARLYRLDHVATRLKRSADSLLVVSGNYDQSVSGRPTLLTDVLRLSLAEIEGFRSIEIGEMPDIAVSAGLVPDLRLLLAELLENAASFSPPGNAVEVSATLTDECRITIVDHGLGMTSARLAEENQRLVERERLDVAPTRVLGLFVVGRLARRHGLTVRLEPSPGSGVTAIVTVPVRLLASATAATPVPALRMPSAPLALPAALAIDGEPFNWFGLDRPLELTASAATSGGSGPNGAAEEAGQIEMAHAVAVEREIVAEPVPALTRQSNMRPAATGRASVTAATIGAATVGAATVGAAAPPQWPIPNGRQPGPEVRGGLTRRVPGTHMASNLRSAPPPAPVLLPTVPAPARDPEAERAQLDDFMAGLARVNVAPGENTDPIPPPSPETLR